ncbi:MAG TPA: glucosaminidase domain-containing protein [candidate division Zixibacteria bacterium]|nr:glucosaminidase domain-containing protein [candidate division Zixibacteria bacterium]
MTKEEFMQKAWAAARKASSMSGLPAVVTVAQAALESNFGQSRLSRESNNYFGLKAHGARTSVAMRTKECDCAGEHSTRARFAVYDSMEDCFEDRDRVIGECSAYAKARECAGDVQSFVLEMAKHWATDPHYSEKLLTLVEQISDTEGK